ncbi:hypothetical protein [uncultured Tateyamaria sp.]|uniref:hypothetical protein n=1 Tax=Tateyamaria sp. 1078 TaxID=3417464 RepID=UPI0026379A97|nr:hypothetical protein [uncultured Tateyamaria sp.]
MLLTGLSITCGVALALSAWLIFLSPTKRDKALMVLLYIASVTIKAIIALTK